VDHHIATELILRLQAQLPDAQELIVERLPRDENFREICLEYEECAKSLAYWRSTQQRKDRVEEYAKLLQELELEILRLLQEKPDIKSGMEES
jgi:hypothetical protein